MRFDLPRGRLRWLAVLIAGGALSALLLHPVVTPPLNAQARNRPAAPVRIRDRASSDATAFWREARLPTAADARPPILIDPASLGVPTKLPPIDHRALLDQLAASGSASEQQTALLDWFAAAPEAARNWLAEHDSLAGFQPALKMISESIASQGDCHLALQWAALMNPGNERDGTVSRIYSDGYRQGRFSMDDLAGAPLTDLDRRNILNGSASD